MMVIKNHLSDYFYCPTINIKFFDFHVEYIFRRFLSAYLIEMELSFQSDVLIRSLLRFAHYYYP